MIEIDWGDVLSVAIPVVVAMVAGWIRLESAIKCMLRSLSNLEKQVAEAEESRSKIYERLDSFSARLSAIDTYLRNKPNGMK